MTAYYNDYEFFVHRWLLNLHNHGRITRGVVDGRDFRLVKGSDVREHERCHFFAGIAGWELALQIVGWKGPVWTASLPCQPFSQAGLRKNEKDSRHLFPQFAELVRECKPPIIFGEQTASKDGRAWFDGVRTTLEEMGYETGCADLCASSVNSPQKRQRLYWVAYSERAGLSRRETFDCIDPKNPGRGSFLINDGLLGGVADTIGRRCQQLAEKEWDIQQFIEDQRAGWRTCDTIQFKDSKRRRIESGLMPLADGVSKRVGLIRGFGNSIVPALASEFIIASIEAISGRTTC